MELDRFSQNQDQTVTYDAAMIAKLTNAQVKREQDINKLNQSKDLWKRNFGILNKTFEGLKNQKVFIAV